MDRRRREELFRKVLLVLLASMIMSLLGLPSLVEVSAQDNQPPNPLELRVGVTSFPSTVDPAWYVDPQSAELIFNVYETLITFNGERNDSFIPMLSTEVPTWENGLILEINEMHPIVPGLYWCQRVIFPIREGVFFHNGDWGPAGTYILSPRDVEYSFERLMVTESGMQFMLLEPLLGCSSLCELGNLSVAEDIQRIGKMIDYAVESNETHVWFNLVNYCSDFLWRLCYPFASVLSIAWMNDYVIGMLGRSDWPGFWGNYENWIEFHDPSSSPLDEPTAVMCGTGPYKLESFDRPYQWSVTRFEYYWGGWPASWPSPPYSPLPSSGIQPRGFVDSLTEIVVDEWDLRLSMFLAGDLDIIAVPEDKYGDLHQNGDPNGPTLEGIRCISIPELRIRHYERTWVQGWYLSPLYLDGLYGRCVASRNKHALVVGVGHRTFENDANWVAELLRRNDWDVSLRTDKTATVSNIQDWLNGAKSYSESDYVLFYFSGHGGNIPDQPPLDEKDDCDEIIKLHDGNITDDYFTEWVRNVTSKHLAIIFDSCHSGGFANITDAHQFGGKFLSEKNGSIIVTAAGGIHGDSDPAYSLTLGYSYFTYCFFKVNWHRNKLELAFKRAKKKMNLTQQWPLLNDRYSFSDFRKIYSLATHAVGARAYGMWKWNYLAGDYNRDGKVDMIDIVLVCDAFGSYHDGITIHPKWNFWCDVDGKPHGGWQDLKIDMYDIVIACFHFGQQIEPWQYPPP